MEVKFSPPDISVKEIDEVCAALKSGWITTGPRTKELEKQVAEFCGVKRAVCLNSQTACAEMALRLLGIGEGDEVITSAYTYSASASVICHVGAKPVLVDMHKKTVLKWIITCLKKRSIPKPKLSSPSIWQEFLAITIRFTK